MGYIRHHAIIISSESKVEIEKWHLIAKQIFSAFDLMIPANAGKLISDICVSAINEVYTFLISPDGSKEGWEPSKLGNKSGKKYVIF